MALAATDVGLVHIDTDIMRDLATAAEKRFEEARLFNMVESVEEFTKTVPAKYREQTGREPSVLVLHATDGATLVDESPS